MLNPEYLAVWRLSHGDLITEGKALWQELFQNKNNSNRLPKVTEID